MVTRLGNTQLRTDLNTIYCDFKLNRETTPAQVCETSISKARSLAHILCDLNFWIFERRADPNTFLCDLKLSSRTTPGQFCATSFSTSRKPAHFRVTSSRKRIKPPLVKTKPTSHKTGSGFLWILHGLLVWNSVNSWQKKIVRSNLRFQLTF